MSIGEKIRNLRNLCQLTQEELASQLYVTSQAVSKWESENGLPDTAQIVPIAKALNVTFIDIFKFEQHREIENLIIEINEILKNNPEKTRDFYKIAKALVE